MQTSKLFIFDLDDTLIATNSIFRQRIQNVSTLLSTRLEAPKPLILSLIENGLSEARTTCKVNPVKLWAHTLDSLQNSFPMIDKNFRSELENEIFLIYKEVPKVFEGAFELLEKLRSTNAVTAILSHAEPEWTNFKLKETGLGKYFDFVNTADVNDEKTSANWQKAILDAGFDEGRCVVIGDNIQGDIVSASEIGVKTLVWVDNKDNWSVHRTGKLPDGTIVVKNLSQISALLDCGEL